MKKGDVVKITRVEDWMDNPDDFVGYSGIVLKVDGDDTILIVMIDGPYARDDFWFMDPLQTVKFCLMDPRA